MKLDMRSVRRAMVLLGIGVLLAGCGLVGGHGSLAKGDKYQAEGKYRAAYIEAKRVLQRNDKDGAAWLLLGRASLMLGNPKDALDELHKAQANGAPASGWSVPLGRALYVSRQYDDLLKTIKTDAAATPADKARIDVLRGDAQRELKQFDAAKTSYQAALASVPKDAGALVGQARLALATGDAAGAGGYLQQALAVAPENPQAWVTKGDLAFAGRDFAGAATDYQKVLGFKHADWLPQERFYALAKLAHAQLAQGQNTQALASVAELEKMAPDQPAPHYLHALALYQQDKLDDAVSQLQLALRADANNVPALMLMGAVNYARGNYSQAQMYLGNVMGAAPGNTEARRLLALTQFREGQVQQALDTLRPALPGHPTDVQLRAALQEAVAAKVGMPQSMSPAATASAAPATPLAKAGHAIQQGNGAEAVELLNSLQTHDASSETQRIQLLVIAYVREGKLDEAIKTAADFAGKHPDDSAAHLLYGTALVVSGKQAQARDQYNQAVRLDAHNIAALLSLGSLDAMQHKYADASGRYQAVLKQDPHDAAALTGLGKLAMLQGDKPQAAKWFQQATVAAPNSVAAFAGLVGVRMAQGQFDEAVKVARQLVAANPQVAQAQDVLGEAELAAGHHDAALAPLQKAVALAPQEPRYRLTLARAQLLGKDTAGATDNLQQILKAQPDNVQAASLLAFVKQQAHDSAGALALARGLQAKAATKAAGYALEGDIDMADKAYAKAAAAYQRAAQIDDGRPLVVKQFLALQQSGAAKPEAVLLAWLGKHGDDLGMRAMLGQYYLGRGENAAAATQYEAVLKAHPDDVAVLNNLAWIYTEQHDPKALATAARAYKLAPGVPSVADTYGWALVAAKQAKQALPILAKAAKAAPTQPSIQYHLAVAQADSGDRAAAAGTLSSLLKGDAKFSERAAAEKLQHDVGGVPSH